MQKITSKATSVNSKRVPRLFTLVDKRLGWKRGTINVDIGAGKYNTAEKFLLSRGVQCASYDPYNRTFEENMGAAIEMVMGSATSTVSNVLNVIKDSTERRGVIYQAALAIRESGVAYFTVYEGDKSHKGKKTTKGWQENRPLNDYIFEIAEHFKSVECGSGLIVAKGPIVKNNEKIMESLFYKYS